MNISPNQVKATFENWVQDIYRKVKGFNDPANNISYEGLELAHRMRTIVDKSDQKNTSYVALKEAEKVFCDVEEVLFDAQMVMVELKKTLNGITVHDTSISTLYRDLKGLEKELNDYIGIIKERYQFVKDVIWGITSINVSVRAKFGDGNVNLFSYEK